MWCFIDQATETIKVTLNSNACICYKLPLRAFFCFITLLLYNIIYASLSNFAPFSLCVFSCKVCQNLLHTRLAPGPQSWKLYTPFQPETSKILTQMLHVSEFPWKQRRPVGLCRPGFVYSRRGTSFARVAKHVCGFICHRPLWLMGGR